MPLSMAETGEEKIVKRVGGKPDTRQFLENLGFTPGALVIVISKINGNMITKIKESRVAIDKAMANKIIVA